VKISQKVLGGYFLTHTVEYLFLLSLVQKV